MLIIASSVAILLGQMSTQARHSRQKLTLASISGVGSSPPSVRARAMTFLPRALEASTFFASKRGQAGRQVPQRSHWLTIFFAS